MRQLLMGDVFRQCGRAVPDRVAAVAAGESVTFAELDQRSDGVAAWLAARTQPGDRVVMWTPTCIDAVVLFASTAKAGVAFCPLNPDASDGEVRRALETVSPRWMVAPSSMTKSASAFADRVGASVVGWDELAAAPLTAEFNSPDFDDGTAQQMVFTSGTTGAPKAAVISHRAQFLRSHPGALPEPRGMGVCVYPLFHVAPWLIATQQWHARDGVVFTADTAPATIAAAVADHGATRLNMIPALWRRLIEHLDGVEPSTGPLATIRFADTGTSATPLALLDSIRALVPGAQLRIFYGSTEAGSVCGLEHRDIDDRPGSIGVPSVSTDIRIDDHGELMVRSPLLFDGYFENPTATAEAFEGEWYRTGDLADVDDQGYVSIVGRAKDVIRTGGESVAPVEVELVLRDAPGVADVAVVGIPHADWGEVVCAVVVVGADATVTLDSLRDHCEGRLTAHKYPRMLHVAPEIPRTPSTGQPQRVLIADLVTESG